MLYNWIHITLSSKCHDRPHFIIKETKLKRLWLAWGHKTSTFQIRDLNPDLLFSNHLFLPYSFGTTIIAVKNNNKLVPFIILHVSSDFINSIIQLLFTPVLSYSSLNKKSAFEVQISVVLGNLPAFCLVDKLSGNCIMKLCCHQSNCVLISSKFCCCLSIYNGCWNEHLPTAYVCSAEP